MFPTEPETPEPSEQETAAAEEVPAAEPTPALSLIDDDPVAALPGGVMQPVDDDPAYAATPLDDVLLDVVFEETVVMATSTTIPETVTLIAPTPSEPPVARKHVPPGYYLETWAGNERMRHLPEVPWLRERIDVVFRNRFELIWAAYSSIPGSDPRRAELETALRALCKAFDRIAEAAKSRHGNVHPPNELHARLGFALDHALAAINSLDPNLFGRRFPVQTLERSKGEALYGSILQAADHLERCLVLARAIDPDLDERLLEGLVTLENPVDARMLVPIA